MSAREVLERAKKETGTVFIVNEDVALRFYIAGLEAAAKVCDANANKDAGDDSREFAAQLCAKDIRKLKDGE